MSQKIFVLLDMHATLQAAHFPKFAQSMGKKSVWEYFFGIQQEVDDLEFARKADADFHAAFMAKK